MKTKVYLFRLIVGLLALTLGISVYFIWQSFTIQTVSEVSQTEQPVLEIVKAQPIFEVVKPASELPKEEETIPTEFEPEGDYYLIGSSPKAFRDFDLISVTTNDYVEKKDGSSYANPIPPKGHIYTKIQHKFTRINISNRQISFETESKNGISYKFTGHFPEEYEDKNLNDWISLEGDLIKLKDGKKVAQMKAKFGYVHDC